MDRNDQRDPLLTSFLCQGPSKSWHNRWWRDSRNACDQTDRSRFVVAGFISLFIECPCQSLPLWFRLPSRWRREAVRLLTKLRHLTDQEKTQSDVKGQENSGQSLGDRLHFTGPAWNPDVTEPVRLVWQVFIGSPKGEQQSASSPLGRNESQHLGAQASGVRLQSVRNGDDDMINLLSPGVMHIPNVLTRAEEHLKTTFGT